MEPGANTGRAGRAGAAGGDAHTCDAGSLTGRTSQLKWYLNQELNHEEGKQCF